MMVPWPVVTLALYPGGTVSNCRATIIIDDDDLISKVCGSIAAGQRPLRSAEKGASGAVRPLQPRPNGCGKFSKSFLTSCF
jgi:hypothetical protein